MLHLLESEFFCPLNDNAKADKKKYIFEVKAIKAQACASTAEALAGAFKIVIDLRSELSGRKKARIAEIREFDPTEFHAALIQTTATPALHFSPRGQMLAKGGRVVYLPYGPSQTDKSKSQSGLPAV